jgi:hypothetical protein
MGDDRYQVSPGKRLRSQVCTTEVIVVRSARESSQLCCGGAPMIGIDEVPDPALSLDPSRAAGNSLGKRYASLSDQGLEVLVTKPGAGTLCENDVPLEEKKPSALPSSD